MLALVTGTLAAVAIVQYPFPGAGLLRAFFVSPMVMPKITLGIAYLILFSKMHIAGGLFGLVLGEAVIVLPFVLTIVGSALANLKPVHREAAADLGQALGGSFYHYATSAQIRYVVVRIDRLCIYV